MNVYTLAFVFGYVLQCISVCVEMVCGLCVQGEEITFLFSYAFNLFRCIACVVVSVSVGVRNWCLLSSGQRQEMFLVQCHLAIK